MMNTSRSALIRILLSLAGAMIFCASASAVPITYEIHVDTSLLFGTTGNLEFFLNPGATGRVDFATATFFDFTTDGGPFATVPPDLGDVVGSLPGPLVLDNGGPGADHAESFTYGNFFDVFVSLDVPVVSPDAGSGSTLGLNVEDSSFSSALTTPPDVLVVIATDTLGQQSVTINNTDAASVTAIPEPATVLLLGSALVGMIARHRKSK